MSIDVLAIIDILPELLSYVIPGYIACYIYRIYHPDYQESRQPLKLIDVNTIVVSFFIKLLVDAVTPVMLLSYRILFYMIAAVLLGILIACITKAEWFEKVVCGLFGSSAADTLWDAMRDPYYGTAIDIVVDDKTYQGNLVSFFNDNGTDWVVIEHFQIISEDGKVEKPEPLSTEDGRTVYPRIAIKLSDCSQFVSYLSEDIAKRR